MSKGFELLESYFSVSLSQNIRCHNKRSDKNEIFYRGSVLHRTPYDILRILENFPLRKLKDYLSLERRHEGISIKYQITKWNASLRTKIIFFLEERKILKYQKGNFHKTGIYCIRPL